MKKISRTIMSVAVAIVILCVCFALRMYMLARHDFWFDEAVTSSYTYPFCDYFNRTLYAGSQWVRTSCGEGHLLYLWNTLNQDLHPPLYYACVYVYSFFFPSPIALRVLSVVLSVGALAVFYALARKFLPRGYALTAVGLMAASPFHLWYAQEARGYTMSCFLFLAAVYCFIRAGESAGKKWWWAFLTSGLSAIATSYYAVWVFILPALIVLRKKAPRPPSRFLVCIGVAFVLGMVALMPLLIQQVRHILQGAFWLKPPSLRVFFFTPLVFLGGYLSSFWQMGVGLALSWSLLFLGLRAFFYEDREKFFVLFCLSLVPVIMIFLLARSVFPAYLDRHFIIFSPFYYILMVQGIKSIRFAWLRSGVIIVLVCFIFVALSNYYRGEIYCYKDKAGDFYAGVHPRKQYMPLVRHMATQLRPGDTIIIADKQSFFLMIDVLRSYPDALHALTFVFRPMDVPFFERRWLKKRIKFWEVCRENDLCEWSLLRGQVRRAFAYDRFWFVASAWDNNNMLTVHSQKVREHLSGGHVQQEFLGQDGFFIWLYERKTNE